MHGQNTQNDDNAINNFENPYFNQEITMSQLQREQQQQQQQQQQQSEQEHDPTFYEELKLGKDGEGFKRLK